uniref:Uncharacterized protein LOC111120284 n=1 Tax=Crassostrea virginica TaxID=6565 RepID=A0A8B8CLJ0_CRAVI|nr:uncharacterized protein LOC111120284 [Crassostrea virginica]
MQKEGHTPNDPKCANYDSAKKNIIVFSGKDDIQSNFYPCNIKTFGISHPSAEHAFQYSKAMRSSDTITASVIQKANSALDAKRIASKITTPDEWLLHQDDIMKQILESKFEQVPDFKEFELRCNDKTKFLEAAYDDYWGSGLDERGTHNTATNALPGINVMGNILTSIARSKREELQRKSSRHGK